MTALHMENDPHISTENHRLTIRPVVPLGGHHRPDLLQRPLPSRGQGRYLRLSCATSSRRVFFAIMSEVMPSFRDAFNATSCAASEKPRAAS